MKIEGTRHVVRSPPVAVNHAGVRSAVQEQIYHVRVSALGRQVQRRLPVLRQRPQSGHQHPPHRREVQETD